MSAVVLYGPPTAGKDTVTAALCSADPRFQLVTKLKHGTGRSAGYRFVTAEELDDLRRRDRIVVETPATATSTPSTTSPSPSRKSRGWFRSRTSATSPTCAPC